jgi:hypothetical protein
MQHCLDYFPGSHLNSILTSLFPFFYNFINVYMLDSSGDSPHLRLISLLTLIGPETGLSLYKILKKEV